MDTQGQHLLVEFWECDLSTLNNLGYLEVQLRKAAEAAKTTVVEISLHQFAPTGVSGVVIISESHLSIHTWPETGYAAVDFYTCGEGDPWKAFDVLQESLNSGYAEIVLVKRGRGKESSSEITQIWKSFNKTTQNPETESLLSVAV